MLRFLVLLLFLANGAYFAWTQGYLTHLGLAPTQQTEPQRMAAQIKPEAIRLLNPVEARRVESAVSTSSNRPTECLQSSALDAAQATSVPAAVALLPAGSWKLETTKLPARWIIYMGKYANADALTKKKYELRELGIPYDTLKDAALEPGLSLGVYATQSQAASALGDLTKRGVRTAKVVQESAERAGQVLQFPSVDDALRGQIEAVKTALRVNAWLACTT